MHLFSHVIRYLNYHLFEVKLDSNAFLYRKWAVIRLFRNLFVDRRKNQEYLLKEDIYLKNRLGTFFIPRMSDYVFSVSSYVERKIESFFNMDADGIFLDIGANAGKYSLLVAKKYPMSKIYCFEPSPNTQFVLRKNIELNNKQKNITLMPFGLSNIDGELLFANSMTFTGVNHIVETATSQHRFAHDVVSVPVYTLDKVIENNAIAVDTIYLIKIDVEGHELRVLEGGKGVLTNMPARSRLIIEIHSEEKRVNDVYELLKQYNFTGTQLDTENHLFIKKND
jgi:FkbM family methyltransferase